MITQTERVYAVFGGRLEVARISRYSDRQLRYWASVGFIPQDEHQELIDLAAQYGYDLTPWHFSAHLQPRQVGEKVSG